MTAITIAICTYKRPHLSDTLASLVMLERPSGIDFQVLVIDNDDTTSAKDLVEGRSFPFMITYRHAPGRNISIARNAALAAARTRFLAFIDDDEIVSHSWLTQLWKARETSSSDVVLGPVNAVTETAALAWVRGSDFHDTRPVYVDGRIVTGYCCNVLLDLEATALMGRRFRLDLGRSGGEDTEFFFSVTRAGGVITYAPDAVVTEVVPVQRQSLAWLRRRRFRSGQTHALLLREHASTSPYLQIVKAGAKALFCGVIATSVFWSPIEWRRWYLRGALHLGVVSGLFGQASAILYGRENMPS